MALPQSSATMMTKEAAEKTARSIFVGNIPYEATEEKLVELFSKAGPVVGFRLVYDRESGKPKGYGFCEYGNSAIAASALRNLQSIEFNGRPLRIGPAAGEQNSAELALSNPSVGPPLESPFGDPVDSQAAPEAISRAVASLPPEQMYELMKQMKLCIQNNPNEARNMLLQNPQLAYALLQAQIVMKIVDPKVAIAMLNRSHDQIPPAIPDDVDVRQNSSSLQVHQSQSVSQIPNPMHSSFGSAASNGQLSSLIMMQQSSTGGGMMNMPPPPQAPRPSFSQPHSVASVTASHGGLMQSVPFSGEHQAPPTLQQKFYPGGTGAPIPVPKPVGFPGSVQQQPPTPFDYQGNAPPRMPMNFHHHNAPPPQQPVRPLRPPASQPITPAIAAAAAASMGPNSLLAGQGEQEKVSLIMQVLQLSDEQLALLPEDQRRSIMILKEQLGKTGAI